MATAELVGTWYPSGYYGHFRSKTRNDILQEYRHAATPSPPSKFIRRVRKSPDIHCFSKHDNRHSFPTDASYFDTGLGRRKANRSFTAFNPEFMTWFPHKQEIAQQGAHASLYKLDFRDGGVKCSDPIPQRVSPRIRRKMADLEANDARRKWISDYKMQFSHGQPNPRIDTDLNTGRDWDGGGGNSRTHTFINTTGRLKKVIPPYLENTRRRSKSAPAVRYSVGDCLVWSPPTAPAPTFTYRLNAQRPSQPHLHPDSPLRLRNSQHHAPGSRSGMTPNATAVSTFSPADQTANSLALPNAHSTANGATVPVVVVD